MCLIFLALHYGQSRLHPQLLSDPLGEKKEGFMVRKEFKTLLPILSTIKIHPLTTKRQKGKPNQTSPMSDLLWSQFSVIQGIYRTYSEFYVIITTTPTMVPCNDLKHSSLNQTLHLDYFKDLLRLLPKLAQTNWSGHPQAENCQGTPIPAHTFITADSPSTP